MEKLGERKEPITSGVTSALDSLSCTGRDFDASLEEVRDIYGY